jgi:hypothetical protein
VVIGGEATLFVEEEFLVEAQIASFNFPDAPNRAASQAFVRKARSK